MSDSSAFLSHWGLNFTPTYHTSPSPSTAPSNTTLRHPFVALITGAGKGLGYHISLAFATAGASGLAISSRTASDLSSLFTALHAINPSLRILSRVCDTTLDADVEKLAEEVKVTFGRLDVCIANAGVISAYIPSDDPADNPPHRLPRSLPEDADFARVLDINLLGSWRVARHFLPLLEATKDGPQSYVLITSMAAHSVSSAYTPAAYNVSKLAGCRLVESIDADARAAGEGVVAFALHPGAVLTPQTEGHTGEIWGKILKDDVGLCGAFCVWLTKEKREWLSGRYVSANWDVDELENMREEIVEADKLKFRMVV